MTPLLVGPYEVGVQQNLKPFMIPEDAFPNLSNALVFRGRIERKDGYRNVGRLRRILTSVSGTNISSPGAGVVTYSIKTALGIAASQPNLQLQPGSVDLPITIVIGAPISQTLTDNTGTGVMTITGAGPIILATVNYATGTLSLTFSGASAASSVTISLDYYPTIPVMGICKQETSSLNTFQPNLFNTIFFDQVYAYRFTSGNFSELPSTLPTTWSGSNTQFFWSTNYQRDDSDRDLFWVTNDNPGFQAYQLNLTSGTGHNAFTNQAAGPPSTVNVETAVANIFQVGDIIYFAGVTGAAAANNLLSGTVTAINVGGNPAKITISNPGTGVFVNGAVLSGMAITPNENISGDGIRYYNQASWVNFNPLTNPINAVLGCLMILPYKDRLVLLNTIEGLDPLLSNVTYNRQRARWSQNGPAIDVINGWRDDIVGKGGFIDAPTGEAIVSAGFIKDQLIVYFERSTWQLVATGNQLLPFVFQRVNAELGAESTFSAVTFDNGLVAFGNVGVHSCNGVQTGRIDQQIPDEIYNIHTVNSTGSLDDGPKRTFGIRNFLNECAYFSYANAVPNTSDANKISFPNKMMIYNYRNDTFSFFDDNATCLGYFQISSSLQWQNVLWTWDEWLTPWNSGFIQGGLPNVCWGNQQGFIEVVTTETVSQDNSLTIVSFSSPATDFIQITSPQHNLYANGNDIEGQYVTISGCIGFTDLNGQSFQIQEVIDADNFTIYTPGITPSGYVGGGLLKVLGNIVIQTKMFTPYWTKGKRYSLKYIDILVDRTENGEINIDIFVDFSNQIGVSMTNSGQDTSIAPNVLLGNSVISTAPELSPAIGQPVAPYYAFQQFGAQIWKRFYTLATGETFQVQLSLNPTQMLIPTIQNSDIIVHAMIFHFEEEGSFY